MRITSKRIEIPLIKAHGEKNDRVIKQHISSTARVLVRMGDILEGGYDLTVLPCSAKGSISGAVKRHTENYDIPFPKPMKHGYIGELIGFKGPNTRTKFVIYAASVFNDFSSPEIIEGIGKRIGDLTNSHPEILLVETPLLGTGHGRVDTLDAALALKRGFELAQTEAALTIFVFDYERYKQISTAFGDMKL